MGRRQAYPCVRLARRCIGSLWRKGESAMDAKDQDFLGMPSGKVSRRQALKWMVAGAAAASFALAGCGGNKDQAKGESSGSGQASGGSASNTAIGQKGSTPNY